MREMFFLLHSFPVNVTLPPSLTSKNDINAYFGAVTTHSGYPNVSYGKDFFDSPNIKFYSAQMAKRGGILGFGMESLLCYNYHEKTDDPDSASVDYIRKSNEYVLQLLQSLNDFGLTW